MGHPKGGGCLLGGDGTSQGGRDLPGAILVRGLTAGAKIVLDSAIRQKGSSIGTADR